MFECGSKNCPKNSRMTKKAALMKVPLPSFYSIQSAAPSHNSVKNAAYFSNFSIAFFAIRKSDRSVTLTEIKSCYNLSHNLNFNGKSYLTITALPRSESDLTEIKCKF